MRFIRGDSLKRAIDKFHSREPGSGETARLADSGNGATEPVLLASSATRRNGTSSSAHCFGASSTFAMPSNTPTAAA